MRPSFLDDVSAAETRRGGGAGNRSARSARCGGAVCTSRRACVISHEMSRSYVLEHPVDDPDDDEDDDIDEDDEDEDGEDDDEANPETWQVSERGCSAKGQALLDFRD